LSVHCNVIAVWVEGVVLVKLRGIGAVKVVIRQNSADGKDNSIKSRLVQVEFLVSYENVQHSPSTLENPIGNGARKEITTQIPRKE